MCNKWLKTFRRYVMPVKNSAVKFKVLSGKYEDYLAKFFFNSFISNQNYSDSIS
jgi:hypothetical protein